MCFIFVYVKSMECFHSVPLDRPNKLTLVTFYGVIIMCNTFSVFLKKVVEIQVGMNTNVPRRLV